MAFKVSPFHKQANGSPFQIKSPLNVSYDAAYDGLSDEKKAEYRKSDKAGDGKGRARFKKEAKDYNEREYKTTEPTKAAKEGKLSDTQKKKLSSEKEEYKKKREVTAKAKADAETKTKVTETKKEEPKTKTGKQRRAEKRVGRLKKKQQKGKKLSASQEKKLARNESKKVGEKVKDEDKTKVGKTIKKGVDKVKDVVKKKKSDNSISDSERANRRKKSGNYNSDGSVKDASERNA